ncbi:methyltransferase domain-containing protein [Streptomyces sedi]|uniref:Protein-L-isoaspartate O-methyltransferase n=1 Tax=Streptomyces sedi TaxID=555059 RepID=A0A5C4VA28_9ACTN|nr:methyltransferase domain-containing protein [Streptomyces sedi]TNM32707.1 methyltransferase domain-containing protein [Streptomyces sedi]
MTTDVTADEARHALVDALTANGSLAHPGWTAAFTAVPREMFVPRFTIRRDGARLVLAAGDPGYLEDVYADTSLVTRWDAAGTAVSSSSEPSLMARMLHAFDMPAGARVLEIGTGTGYNTALLCHHLGDTRVTTIDIDPALTTVAAERLAAAGHHPHVVTGDGTAGHPEGAPYDGILATCGVHRVPTAWLEQVRPGGLVVTNISNGIARLTVADDGSAHGRFLPAPAMFMRARPDTGHVAPAARQYAELVATGTATGRRRAAALPAEVDEDAFYRELVFATAMETCLAHHDVLALSLSDPDSGTTHGLIHPPTGSWARITPQPGRRAHVEHSGPRDLWDERLRFATRWLAAGSPGPDAYTLRVTRSGDHTLRRDGNAPADWTV